jgi:glycerol uptake facilitator-like aquaporin
VGIGQLNYRALLSEYLGTAILVATVIGSGIMGTNLSNDSLLVLLINVIATILVLGILILTLDPVSGAHFNPLVSIALAITKQFPTKQILPYVFSQVAGAIFGAVIANAMFGQQLLEISTKQRFDTGGAIGEVVATALLLFVILALVRTQNVNLVALAVPAVIGAASFFTSSASFVNPAVTIGRIFSDSFAGIAPSSVPGFIVFQFIGTAIAIGLVKLLFIKKP